MTPLYAAALASECAAAASGVVLAIRRREHAPAAVALCLLVGAAVVQLATAPSRLVVLIRLDRVVVLGAVAVVPGIAVSVFLSPRRRRRALACVVGAWALASVTASLYPLRAPSLQRLYLAASLVGDFVALAALFSWARWQPGRVSPGSSHAVALALVFLDLALLLTPFSPWRGSLFGGRFDTVQIEILGLFAVVTIAQVILWSFSSRASG